MDLRKNFGAVKSRLMALNVHDAVMQLNEGSCDLLIADHHPSQPLQLNPDRCEMLSVHAPFGHSPAGLCKSWAQGLSWFCVVRNP